MKKIYLISYYFAPLGRADGVNRTYLVKYLNDLGWDIEVISCQNPHGWIRNFQKDFSLLKVIPENVHHHRIKSFYWGPFGEIASLLKCAKDPFWNWAHAVRKQSDHIFKNEGIVYAIVPPVRNALIAAQIAKKYNLPLILDFRDNVFNLSRKIVLQAATIIASTPNSLLEMQNYYGLKPGTGHVVYNGYPLENNYIKPEKIKSDNKLKIIFTGLLNYEHDPAMLIQAVNYMEYKFPELKNRIEINYYGPENYYTNLFLKKKMRNNIHFHGYIEFEKVLSKIADSDLTYCPIALDKKSYAIPSKVFQYIAMETPILGVGPNGALKNLIEQNGIGFFSHYKNIDSQANDLYNLLTKPHLHKSMVNNLKKIKKNFSMKKQVEHLSAVLQKHI